MIITVEEIEIIIRALMITVIIQNILDSIMLKITRKGIAS
ncbi:MAG: hypothetical protein RIT27_89 [Pseudomonadota bacterium]|jgi:hypothetical protein